MKEKNVILTARIISMIFTPFYLPLVGVAVLFFFSYLKIMPWQYQLQVFLMVYLFTILLPTLLIRLYRKAQGWSLIELGVKDRRIVPYIISIVCYFACYYVMGAVRIPYVISDILVVAISIQIICAGINVMWKISTHSAAIGGIAGALIAYSLRFSFNPVWWLCLVLIVAGLVGTSRMILRQHTLPQVVVGFFVGFACATIILLRS